MQDTLSWALDLLSHGYSVIPILRQAKKSAIKWKEFQSRRPTECEVERWFKGNDYNIAVVTGEVSGCVVIDADDDNAVMYCNLSFPITPMRVCTRKGKHYFFRHPGRHTQSKARILDEPPIDIRADGGIAVTLGSRHESGHIYTLDDGCDLYSAKELPLYDPLWFPVQEPPHVSIARVCAGGDAYDRAARYMHKAAGAGSGQRNDKLFKLAAVLTHDFGLSQEQAEVLLSQWNTLNSPPLPEYELKRTIASSIHTGQNPFGSKL